MSNPTPDFRDTETAFKLYQDRDLRESQVLFKLIGLPKLTRFLSQAFTRALRLRLPVKGIIRHTMYKHFCGGETIEECLKKSNGLSLLGVKTIVDYSVEALDSDESFAATEREIFKTLDHARLLSDDGYIVFKPSALLPLVILEAANEGIHRLSPLQYELYDKGLMRMQRICQRACDFGVRVLVDAEETWIQDSIDRIVFDLMVKHNSERAVVFNTLQMYRRDRLQYLERKIEECAQLKVKFGAKLVRGAYLEKEIDRAREYGYTSPLCPDKASTDANFDQAISICLSHLDQCEIFLGTHNENSCLLAIREMANKSYDLKDARISFSQLLGMSDHISFNLAKHKYRVFKLMPYGPVAGTLPYLVRRAEENTSISGQMSRELLMIGAELERRNKSKTLN